MYVAKTLGEAMAMIDMAYTQNRTRDNISYSELIRCCKELEKNRCTKFNGVHYFVDEFELLS